MLTLPQCEPAKGGSLSDGTYRFWPDQTAGLRWRWARIEWSDNGIGVASHGAQRTLLRARIAAWTAERERRAEA